MTIFEQLIMALGHAADLMPDVVLAARADLSVPIDSAKYGGLFAEQQQAMTAAVREVQEQLKGAHFGHDQGWATAGPAGRR